MNALEVVASESTALAVAASVDLDAEVPSCPGWRVRDLVRHVGTVQRFHALHVTRGVTDEPTERPVVPEGDAGLVGWFTAGTAELLAALTALPVDAPAWTWAPHLPQVVGFWHRRMALEAVVHRWDAQGAFGQPLGVRTEVAVDGIDEVLLTHLPTEPRDVAGVVQVVLTDADAGWTVDLGQDVVLTQKTPDAVLEGTASGVFLALWGRVPLASLGVRGDASLVAALRTG